MMRLYLLYFVGLLIIVYPFYINIFILERESSAASLRKQLDNFTNNKTDNEQQQEINNTKTFHNVCIERKPGTKNAHLLLHKLDNGGASPSSYADTSEELLWIWPINNDTLIKKDDTIMSYYWIEEPTLLLTGPYNNPNHLFWDVLVNLFPWYNNHYLPFNYWSFPDHPTPCVDSWLCEVMPSLLQVLNLTVDLLPLHELSEEQNYGAIVVSSDNVPCYRSVWIPNFSYYRGENHPIPNEDIILPKLHEELTRNFQQQQQHDNDNVDKVVQVFIYGHLDSNKRQWQNVNDVAMKLKSTNIDIDVDIVHSLRLLPFQTQCYKFWNANIIIYVHGGHTANLICSRPNTHVIELSCQYSFGWSQLTSVFHSSLGLRYESRKVPGCTGHDSNLTTPDDWFTPESLLASTYNQQVLLDMIPSLNKDNTEESAHWKVDLSKRENFTDTVKYQGAEWPLARSFEVYKVGSSQVGATAYNANGLVVRLGKKEVGDEGMNAYHFNKWYWEIDATDEKLQSLVKKGKIQSSSNTQQQCDDTKSYFSLLQRDQDSFQHIAFETLPKISLSCEYLATNTKQYTPVVMLVNSLLQQELIQEVCPALDNDRFEIYSESFASSCYIYVPIWKQHPPNKNDPLQMGMTQRGIMRPLGSSTGISTPAKVSSNQNKTVVYLSRGTNGKRSVKNEAKILDIIRSLGFKVEVPHLQNNWKIDRQVIEKADIIVGPHGGALSNMIFANPETKVVEFLPLVKLRKKVENSRPCYFGLALSLGLDYEALEPTNEPFDFDQPMIMDEAKVKKLFQTMVGM